MKLLVLGATGRTGRQIVSQALDAGHEVTAVARDRGRTGADHPRLRVIVGEMQDAATLTDAMRGQDAVISALRRGLSFTSEQFIQRTVPGVVTAMQAAGVRRLLFTSAMGVGESVADAPLLPRLFFRTLLRDIYADKLVGDRLIEGSGLDWTIVRPTQLTDGALTAKYRSGDRLAMSGMPKISREDVAHFILRAAADPATIGKKLIVSQ